MNLIGKFIVAYLINDLVMLFAGLLFPKLLTAGFMLFVIGIIPCSIGLFFIEFDNNGGSHD